MDRDNCNFTAFHFTYNQDLLSLRDRNFPTNTYALLIAEKYYFSL